MSIKEIMLYRIKARGLYVKKHNENVTTIKLEKQEENKITFSVTGVSKKQDSITMDIVRAY